MKKKKIYTNEILTFDSNCTYTLPLLKEGLDRAYDLEDVVSGAKMEQNEGFITLSKNGYESKCFTDRNFEWLLYLGYVRKDE